MKNMRQLKKNNKGFTLVELMIATTLSTLMSLGVLSIYISQSANLTSEIQRDTTAQEAHRAFDIISRLIRQAEQASIQINYNTDKIVNNNNVPEIDNDAITIDFTLPANQDIWPNIHTAGNPADNNAVRLAWHNNIEARSPYQIQIGNTTSIANLGAANMNILAGSNNQSVAQIINLDLWPLQNQRTLQAAANATPNSGYLLRITTRATTPDLSYTHPNDTRDNYKHYRTYTVSGIVTPRN